MKFEKIVLVGHSDGGVPVVMDLASEILGVREFDIIKNVDRPNCPFPESLYKAFHFFDHEYDFGKEREFPTQFGVHHGNVKYLLYHYFNQKYHIHKNQYINLIHPMNYIATSAVVDKGFLMEPMSVVSSMCKIGFGVTLKRSSSVGHHAIIEDFANINPGAVLAGFCTVGEGSEIGVGATVSNNVRIGKRCLIGAGSVVTRDIPDGVIAYGNPCKVIRENERWAKIPSII
jgi:sugar O-acyltransferase (sialic acid O-acetyltransferase NeuD family)